MSIYMTKYKYPIIHMPWSVFCQPDINWNHLVRETSTEKTSPSDF